MKTITKENLDRIKTLKSAISFYQTMVDKMYKEVVSITKLDNDYLFDSVINNFIPLAEALDKSGIQVENSNIKFEKVKEHGDGTATYTYEISEELENWLKKELKVKKISSEVLEKHILGIIEKMEKE